MVYWLYVGDERKFSGIKNKICAVLWYIYLRHTLNDFLKALGNCGYSVRPSERRKGYGTEMLRLLQKIAVDAGMTELYLSVERDNEPSVKTIVKNDGVYEPSFAFEGGYADVRLLILKN